MKILIKNASILFFVMMIMLTSYSKPVSAISDDPIVFSALILGNISSGSGFYVNDGKYMYIVTAKHVLYNRDTNFTKLLNSSADVISYSRNSHKKFDIGVNLIALDNTNNIKKDNNKDIAVVRIASFVGNKIVFFDNVQDKIPGPETFTSNPITMLKPYDNALIGNDVYVFGFPRSIGMQEFPQIDYEKPLLRKGIIAGKNDITRTLILDCFIYWGNSGGPVLQAVQKSVSEREYSIIGMITDYVPLIDRWNNVHQQFKIELSNSGYSVAVSSEDIIKIIQKW